MRCVSFLVEVAAAAWTAEEEEEEDAPAGGGMTLGSPGAGAALAWALIVVGVAVGACGIWATAREMGA